MAGDSARRDDAELVRLDIEASTMPDPVAAARNVGDTSVITCIGGRAFDHPLGTAEFNAARHKWAKKRMGRFIVRDGEIVSVDVSNDSADRILTHRRIVA
jgi:hypothetical protein